MSSSKNKKINNVRRRGRNIKDISELSSMKLSNMNESSPKKYSSWTTIPLVVATHIISYCDIYDWASIVLVSANMRMLALSPGSLEKVRLSSDIPVKDDQSLWKLRLRELSIKVTDDSVMSRLASMTSIRALDLDLSDDYCIELHNRVDDIDLDVSDDYCIKLHNRVDDTNDSWVISRLSSLTSLRFVGTFGTLPPKWEKHLSSIMTNIQTLCLPDMSPQLSWIMTSLTSLELTAEYRIDMVSWKNICYNNSLTTLKCPHLALSPEHLFHLSKSCHLSLRVLHIAGISDTPLPETLPFSSIYDLWLKSLPNDPIWIVSITPPSLRCFGVYRYDAEKRPNITIDSPLERLNLGFDYDIRTENNKNVRVCKLPDGKFCNSLKYLLLDLSRTHMVIIPSTLKQCTSLEHLELMGGSFDDSMYCSMGFRGSFTDHSVFPRIQFPQIHSLTITIDWEDDNYFYQWLTNIGLLFPNISSLTIRNLSPPNHEFLSFDTLTCLRQLNLEYTELMLPRNKTMPWWYEVKDAADGLKVMKDDLERSLSRLRRQEHCTVTIRNKRSTLLRYIGDPWLYYLYEPMQEVD